MAKAYADTPQTINEFDGSEVIVVQDGSLPAPDGFKQMKKTTLDDIKEWMLSGIPFHPQSMAYDKVIGDGRKSYTIVHGLNSDALMVQLWSTIGEEIPFYYLSRIDSNTIQIDFDGIVQSNSVQVVIQANKYTVNSVTLNSVDWSDITNIPFMPYDEMVTFLEE